MAQVVIDYIYGFSGDISYATNYFRQEEMGDVVAQPGIKTVSFEATVTCMLESPKKSEVITLKEMTPDNLRRLSSFIQPVAGRFPEEVDEILIPPFIKPAGLSSVTAFTYQRLPGESHEYPPVQSCWY